MTYYAGVGSRTTPVEICVLMSQIAQDLSNSGWTLRSGHAEGADKAFELGAGGRAEIYLPWRGFTHVPVLGTEYSRPEPWTEEVAATYHPRWVALSPIARKLHMRNVHQVLGHLPDSEHSRVVVCWTPNASGSGGTGQAIRIANGYNIPVFDLADHQIRQEFEHAMRCKNLQDYFNAL